VREISTNPNDAVIVEIIISMAQQFGYQVIAEGVESVEQQQTLQVKGCVNFQGYYFSHPLRVGEFIDYLNDASVFDASILEQVIPS